jgi:phage gp29-like protein
MLRSLEGQEEEWSEFLPDKFLIAVAKQKSGHPCGSALLQALGFFWAATNFSWEWFLNFAQLFGVPIRWANYASTADATTISKIEEMMQELGSAGWAAFPQGTQLQILEAVKASAEGPQERLIVAADRICDILILGQTLTTDVAGSGSRALGDVHKATLSDREEAVARFAARILNAQLVPAFCRLNFGDDEECPWLVPDIEEEENSKLLAETFEVAARIGVKIPTKYAHERLGIPQPVDGEDVLEASPTAPGPGDSKTKVSARSAERSQAAAVAESVTGVSAEWLRGTLPWFEELIAAAQDPSVTEAEFGALVVRAKRALPEDLAPLLNVDKLAHAIEAISEAAVQNGVRMDQEGLARTA